MATTNDNGTSKMKTSDTEAYYNGMRDSVELRHGLYFLLCTVLFFQFVNWIIKSQGPPKSLKEDEWKWRNLYVSWIHSFLCSIWIILSFLLYPEIINDLLQQVNYFIYFNVCFATGYFFYDFLDLLVNNKLIQMWEVTLHHFAVIGMFYYNIHLRQNIGFNIVALLVEINTFFLHWRKLYQMVGISYSSRRYLIIKYVNLITFFIFRGGPCLAITIAIFFWRLKVSHTYYLCIIISMIFMDVLNIILFSRLIRSDVLRPRGPDGKSLNGVARSRSSCAANVRRDCQDMNGYQQSLLSDYGEEKNGVATNTIQQANGGGHGDKKRE